MIVSAQLLKGHINQYFLPKAQGTMQNREIEIKSVLDDGQFYKMLFPEYDRDAAHMNSQNLWQPAQNLLM